MANLISSSPTHRPLPIILIRGFGGLTTTDEQKIAYQGFNEGSVYPQKRGESYVYEGMILRFLKSDWRYRDATNVMGFYSSDLPIPSAIPTDLKELDPANFSGRVLLDPSMALQLLRSNDDPRQTLWVFRYYDLNDRIFSHYGEALVRLIECIRSLVALKLGGDKPKVNIIAHSMGG